MNRSDYQEYLASREWALKREAVRARSGNKCERVIHGVRCPNPHESTHHTTYANVGHEPLEDLMAVCNDCHRWLSGKTNVDVMGEIILDLLRQEIIPCGCCGKGFHTPRPEVKYWGPLPPCSVCGANGVVRGQGPYLEGPQQ